jgi:hypothetical protein
VAWPSATGEPADGRIDFRIRVVCHERRLNTTVRNCTRDEGGPFEAGSQVLASNHCKLLSPKAMVVSVAVNVGTKIPAGAVERGERKRTVDEVSKAD